MTGQGDRVRADDGPAGRAVRSQFVSAEPEPNARRWQPRSSRARRSFVVVALCVALAVGGYGYARWQGGDATPADGRSVAEVFRDATDPPVLAGDLGAVGGQKALVAAASAAGAGEVPAVKPAAGLPVGVMCEVQGRAASATFKHVGWAATAQYRGEQVVVLGFSSAITPRPMELLVMSVTDCQVQMRGRI